MKSVALALSFLFVVGLILFPFNHPQAAAATTGATVQGKVITWGSSSAPAAGCKVELRKGPFGTLIATKTTDSKGQFVFTGVNNSSGSSFHVKAFKGYHVANWYFQVGSGGTATQTLKLSP